VQAKEKEQENLGEDSMPMLQSGKGCWQCSKEGHIAAECPEQRRAAKSLRHVNDDNKRQLWSEPCQAKQLQSTIVQKPPHQQVLEANQGDWLKELVVKSLVPQNRTELRGFLKWANHYHHFVKDYSVVVKPLTVLTSSNVEWTWSSAQKKAFDEVKQRLTLAPILAYPVNGKPFHLCTNASDYAIGAVLEQEGEDGQWHIVAYGSRSLTNAERKWSSTEKECFAVVHFMNHWWHLLLGVQFDVLTDQQALSKMFGQAELPTGKLARWVSKMQPFKPFNVKCWSSGNSDALSRELKTGQVATFCKDVEQWVMLCRTCQERLDPQALKAARQQTIKTMQALEKMGMDLIGPLPKSKQGHIYALVMQDHFTKWPKAIPLKDATAKSVAGVLLSVILMWAPPAELLSNQGLEFVVELNCKLLRQQGIKRQYARRKRRRRRR